MLLQKTDAVSISPTLVSLSLKFTHISALRHMGLGLFGTNRLVPNTFHFSAFLLYQMHAFKKHKLR